MATEMTFSATGAAEPAAPDQVAAHDGSPSAAAAAAADGPRARARNALSALRVFGLLLTLALLSTLLVIVPAGERGVLLRFGAVQPQVLDEGLHPLLPLVYSVVPVSVRVRSQLLHSEAASRDLQDVHLDVALNWHIEPSQVAAVYQRLGDGEAIVAHVIEPSLEDGLKAVVASVTAEQLISERAAVKANLDQLLSERLSRYDLRLDGIDWLQVDFSDRFRQAVEAKQVAEQDARRAEFEAGRARRQAEARVFQAQGEAQAQQLLQTGLTPELLERQAIEKWNGHLPLVMGGDSIQSLDLKSMFKNELKSERRR